MNKPFVKEDAPEEEEAHASAPVLPHVTKNYMTRRGYALLKAELEQLVKGERSVGRCPWPGDSAG